MVRGDAFVSHCVFTGHKIKMKKMSATTAGAEPGPGFPGPARLDGVAESLVRRFPGFYPDQGWLNAEGRYPALSTPHYLALIREPTPHDPVFRQIAPSGEELEAGGDEDAVGEEQFMAAAGLLHRYPDRALILASTKCLVHCRHCMRKRLWNKHKHPEDLLGRWVAYLESHPEINEVILSGGDPFCLSDSRLKHITAKMCVVKHVLSIRIHTRAVAVAPGMITPDLARFMAAHKVNKVVVQFNHPVEITDESQAAAETLSRAGIKVMNQNVLLRGVNDSPEILAELFTRLVQSGIMPYYLHHPDRTRGAMHFHLSPARGLELFERALALAPPGCGPEYVVDRPGAAAKTVVRDCFASDLHL